MDSMSTLLTEDPPYGAEVKSVPFERSDTGWNAPALAPWLEASVQRAGETAFGQPMALHGRGRHDPLHGRCWARNFPRPSSSSPACSAPHSNAHGPNEFLHIPTGKRVSETVALVLADHGQR